MAKKVKDWIDLARRLRMYGEGISRLGGLNDLDKALYMAAEGLEMYAPKLPKKNMSKKA